jgi:peptide/nickel transport system ATP-binding protein
MAGGPDLLCVEELTTQFHTLDGIVRAVDGVSFTIPRGSTMGLVGESGCGKSVTALSIMGLVDRPGRVTAGRILFAGQDLLQLPAEEMREVRGSQVSMVFQEPMTSLNPVYTIGDQIAETVRHHGDVSRRVAWKRAEEMLELVRIPDAGRRANDYPHQMSGGMRQRVMIAIALCCSPQLLIADEPTTALDVTIQAQILDLLRDLQRELRMSVLLITHDLAVVADMCEDVAVMYAGQVVEQATARDLFRSPQHPYTEGLLESVPKLGMTQERRLGVIRGIVPSPLRWPHGCRFAARCDHRFDRCAEPPALFDAGVQRSRCWLCESGPRESRRGALVTVAHAPAAPRAANGAESVLLRVEALTKHFPLRYGLLRRVAGHVRAVDGVDLVIHRGETLGLVGESGCGKTTLGRTILRLVEPSSGRIEFDGRDLTALPRRALKPLRAQMQMIFQDPIGSLNPRMSVGDIVGEGLLVHGMGSRSRRQQVVRDTLERVGLRPEHVNRYPHEFSGGQRQRIGIARSLALSPRLIVADEPVSALDVSIQSQILNLLVELKRELDLTYLFVAHNLAVVAYISDRVAVMYLGRIVEVAPSASLYQRPLHPYTESLLSAIPDVDPLRRRQRIELVGDVPSPINPPSGCRFRTRCPMARARGTQDGICAEVEPPLAEAVPGRWSACHFASDL